MTRPFTPPYRRNRVAPFRGGANALTPAPSLTPGAARALGLVLGVAADALWADPARWHPVAGFGRLATALERAWWRDTRAAGVRYAAVLVGGSAGLGIGAEALGWVAARRGRPGLAVGLTAAATWAVLGGTSLGREARAVSGLLAAGDLPGARARVGRIVSRDTSALDADGVARAALESLAENTSDAVVAPLLWGAVAGIPGLLGYRAANTLDAMVGYRNPRYLAFGWASARLDDALNYAPARLTGALAAALAPLVGGHPRDARRAVREQAGAHPSPNGGIVEASFAGALGVTLGGTNCYDGVVEDRGRLGFGPAPTPRHLVRATVLARAVCAASAVAAASLACALGGVRGARSRR